MAPLPVRLALRRTLKQIRYVRPVRVGAATGLVAQVYRQMERDFGLLAPPVALHAPAPQVLAASWLMLRETLVAAGPVDRAVREAVAAAVSAENTCPYCVEVHSTTLRALGSPTDADALATDRLDTVGDTEVGVVARWVRGRGAPPPVRPDQLAQLIGVATTFHYLNRMVDVFLGDSPLPAGIPAAARPRARGVLGRILRPHGAPEPGRSLPLLPAATPASDLSWAAGNRTVADAFARAAAAIEAAGRRTVSPTVRQTVRRELETWAGWSPGPGRAWLKPVLAGLSAADRPAGRLALLVAKAPYQIDRNVVDNFRHVAPGDRPVLELTSWASLAAARRRGELLAAGTDPVKVRRPDDRADA